MDAESIQWLADELEIRNLIASLALISDMGDLDERAALFADDAVYTTPRGEWVGREKIRLGDETRRAHETHGPGSSCRHLSTTVRVRRTGPDSAEADSYFSLYRDIVMYRDIGEEGRKAPTLLVMGHYHDTFRRTDEGWRVTRRDLTSFSRNFAIRDWNDAPDDTYLV